MKRDTRYEIRDTSGEGLREMWARPGEVPGGVPESEPVSLLAACLFFVGLFAAAGAVVMGVVFFWPWLVMGVEWVGWVLGEHPGLVMVGLIGVAVGALRLSRWADGGHGRG